jgi:hypothetical protein
MGRRNVLTARCAPNRQPIKLKPQTKIDDETLNVREKPLLRSPFIPRHRPMFGSYI